MFKHQYVYNQDLVYKAEQKTFKKIDSFKVMQRAAKVCYAFIVKNLTAKKILILCGPGNNAGDGFIIGNYLNTKNYKVDLFCLKNKSYKGDALKALKLLKIKTQNISMMPLNWILIIMYRKII